MSFEEIYREASAPQSTDLDEYNNLFFVSCEEKSDALIDYAKLVSVLAIGVFVVSCVYGHRPLTSLFYATCSFASMYSIVVISTSDRMQEIAPAISYYSVRIGKACGKIAGFLFNCMAFIAQDQAQSNTVIISSSGGTSSGRGTAQPPNKSSPRAPVGPR